MSTKTEVHHVHFSITGEGFTRTVRDMWVSLLPKKAIKLCLDGLQGMTQEQALMLLTGKAKIVGDTRKNPNLDFEEDNAKFLDKRCSIPLYSIEEIVDRLEKDLLRLEIRHILIVRDNLRSLEVIGTLKTFDEDDCKTAKAIGTKIKSIVDELLYIYPLVKKTIADLPIYNLENINKEFLEVQGLDELAGENYEGKTANSIIALSKRRISLAQQMNGLITNLNFPTLNVDDFVKKTIEANHIDKCKPVSVKKTIFTSGYIAPNGDFYGCGDLAHVVFAEELQDAGVFTSKITEPQAALDSLDWVKLSMNRIHFFGKKISKQQVDTIFDYFNNKKWKKFSYNYQEVTFNEFLETVEELNGKL